MINENWARWIFASCTTFFDSKKGNLFLRVDAEEEPTPRPEDYAEMRFNGPFYTEQYRDYWKLEIHINVLIEIVINQTDDQKIFRTVAIVEKMFDRCIPIYKYGDSIVDDRTIQLGVLTRIPVGKHDIVTNHFGQITPDMRMLQSTVEGHYITYLHV